MNCHLNFFKSKPRSNQKELKVQKKKKFQFEKFHILKLISRNKERNKRERKMCMA